MGVPVTRRSAGVSAPKHKGIELDHDSESKRAKKTGPTGGLPRDWRKLIVSQTACSRSSASTPANDEEEVRVTGEFDDNEDVEQLKAVRNSKLSVKLKMSIQMCVKIQEVNIRTIKTDSEAAGAAVKYKKMPKACLPFPGGNLGQKALEKWNKVYKTTAITFAASLDQPFSSNALLHDHVQEWWDSVFNFVIDKHWTWTLNKTDALSAVVEQTSKMERALELWADGKAPVTSKAKPGTEDNTRNSKKPFGGEDWITLLDMCRLQKD
ncbi:hypothetical protein H0H81_002832 [Sphagnurus paluster]|uniref:Uncharacterized protein n=1 Tax=Sphagnurus paluster TaxID=117069 RepID=A0A9P7FQ73_9AGAR|nr:hypothetical protein H0H81_002832 [Sphagnurus paluster]